MNDISQMLNWSTCEWCGMRWKPQKKVKWLGRLICPKCQEFPKVILHRLVDYKIVKLRKKSKMPPTLGRKRDWGHLGTFDPNRPWMVWKKCEFCTQPMAVNNNAEHQIRLQKFRGHRVCVHCIRLIRLFMPELVRMKYLRLKEKT